MGLPADMIKPAMMGAMVLRTCASHRRNRRGCTLQAAT